MIKQAQNGFFFKNVSLTKTHVSDSGPYSPSVFICIHFLCLFGPTSSPAYIINKLFNGYNKAITLLYS